MIFYFFEPSYHVFTIISFLSKTRLINAWNGGVSFDKTELFSRMRVLGQVDRKFIATVVAERDQKELLVLFDQHAVHERIRLEEIYRGKII